MPKVPHKDFGHVREFEGSLSTQLSKSEDENEVVKSINQILSQHFKKIDIEIIDESPNKPKPKS